MKKNKIKTIIGFTAGLFLSSATEGILKGLDLVGPDYEHSGMTKIIAISLLVILAVILHLREKKNHVN